MEQRGRSALLTVLQRRPLLIVSILAGCLCQQEPELSSSSSAGKRKSGEDSATLVKKLKVEVSLDHPPFYYSIHRHSIRGMNMPK